MLYFEKRKFKSDWTRLIKKISGKLTFQAEVYSEEGQNILTGRYT